MVTLSAADIAEHSAWISAQTVRAEEKRLTRESDERARVVAERDAGQRAERAWMAQRDAYAAVGDWLMVLEMDNA